MEKLVFFGGSSLLAINWANRISSHYEVYLIMHKRLIDLPNVNCIHFEKDFEDSLISFLGSIKPDLIVNCAGLTNVDQCEVQIEEAKLVNQDWPKKLAQISLDFDCKFVHISTDHLYGDEKNIYTEKDQLRPLNVYAKTKALGELNVKEINPQALIVRTNFYGWGLSYRKSFSDFILDGLRKQSELNLFNDVYYTPIYMGELIRLLHLALEKKLEGVYNFVGNENITKYEFGKALAQTFSFSSGKISSVSIATKTNLVLRPKVMSLSNHKLRRALGVKIPSLNEQLKMMLKEEPKQLLI